MNYQKPKLLKEKPRNEKKKSKPPPLFHTITRPTRVAQKEVSSGMGQDSFSDTLRKTRSWCEVDIHEYSCVIQTHQVLPAGLRAAINGAWRGALAFQRAHPYEMHPKGDVVKASFFWTILCFGIVMGANFYFCTFYNQTYRVWGDSFGWLIGNLWMLKDCFLYRKYICIKLCCWQTNDPLPFRRYVEIKARFR